MGNYNRDGRSGGLDRVNRASRAISLVLISSIAVFFGFKSCYEAQETWDNDDSLAATTQPGGSSSGSHGGTHYWYSGSRGYSGSHSSSSGSHFGGGTSRGGFGSSGHAASS